MTELEAETLAYNCWMSARAACNTNAADLRAFSADSYYSFCELSGISPKPTTEQVRAGTVAYCGWLSVISGKEDHAAMKAHGPDSYRSFIVKAMSH